MRIAALTFALALVPAPLLGASPGTVSIDEGELESDEDAPAEQSPPLPECRREDFDGVDSFVACRVPEQGSPPIDPAEPARQREAASETTPEPALADPSAEAPSPNGEPRTKPVSIHRRRRLTVGLGVSAALVPAGALALIPLATLLRERDGPILLAPIMIGSTLMIGGGLATTILASVLGHHDRWERPGLPDEDPIERKARAEELQRSLGVGLGVSLSTAALGGAAMGIGVGASAACPFDDDRCNDRRWITGYAVGLPLIIGGSLSTIITGTLFILHRVHDHADRRSRVRLHPAVGGLAGRF